MPHKACRNLLQAFSFFLWNKPLTFAKFWTVRILFFFFTFFIWQCGISQSTTDVLHYRFEIGLNDQNDSVNGRATVTVRLLRPAEAVTLDLTSIQKNGKGMSVLSVEGAGISGYSHTGEKLRIDLNKPVRDNDTLRFNITYAGIPANGLIISKNKFGKRTFFSDNWPNRAHHWLPCRDDPADKAAVDFIVTAPAHYQVVSNGIQVEESNWPGNLKLTHWKEEVPLPTKVMVIGVAEFAVQQAGSIRDCIPVSTWVFPENREKGFHDFSIARDILAWHENYIGPYAYKKLANVQSKTMFGGMENAGAIFYFENSVTGNRSEENLQSHEIVHQWFGNHATEKSFAHLWLSEGFATYLTHVYTESKKGTAELNRRMRVDRETVLEFVRSRKRPVVDTTSNYMLLLNANSYQKGSWVLHMLRRELGDSVFHKTIRDYYASFGGRNADTKDLQSVFEVNSGKKLDVFFRQWLYLPVNPKLDIHWRYLPGGNDIEVTVSQLQDTEPFVFPLELELKFADSRYDIRKLQIDKKKETFTLKAGAGLTVINPDPHCSLLAEFSVSGK